MNATVSARDGIEELAREANRIVNLILHTNMPRVDIRIQIENLREACEERYPGSGELFEKVYGSRFRRIWNQWEKDRPVSDEITASAWDE